jgi:3',5'-cyclic AMP phosphodiesterase CpdA
MKKATIIILLITFSILFYACQETQKEVESFSFAFITDIHIMPEKQAVEGFRKSVDDINAMNPDFVITGGDLIMDALRVSYGRADSLYNIYTSEVLNFEMPVYNTIGNHEIFGIYEQSKTSPDHPEYGYKMYEKRIGERYYSFDHKGWHFIILNSIQYKDQKYYGMIDEKQMEWMKRDLLEVDPQTPIVISTHIPFITVFTQYLFGEYAPDYHGLIVENTRDVLDLFMGHNLKLVLQGHLHYLEYIELDGISFITGGAISARWWEGPNHNTEEGYLMLYAEGDDFTWEYVDYEWDALQTPDPY